MQQPCRHITEVPQMKKFHCLFRRDLVSSVSKAHSEPVPSVVSSTWTLKYQPLHNPRASQLKAIHSKSEFFSKGLNVDMGRRRFSSGSNSMIGEIDPLSDELGTSSGEEDSNDGSSRPGISSDFGVQTLKSAPNTSVERAKKYPVESGIQIRSQKTENHSVSNGNGVVNKWSLLTKKLAKAKRKVQWVCDNCGVSYGQWQGYCKHCGEMNTLKQFYESQKPENRTRGADVSENIVRSWLRQQPGDLRPQRLTEVNKGLTQIEWRIPLPGLFGAEVSRVLGGGVVPGSLVLVGGDPGVGKSTLLLQIAAMLAEGNSVTEPSPVIYVSGEESVEQIGHRADRMKIWTNDLFLYSSTDIEDILEKIQILSPRALVVDSIQTVYLRGVPGSAGSVNQVRECTSALLRFAKESKIPVLLIGHVTKAGDIAGPRVLEHIVDTVLYMEGERYSSHRLLRSVKNRFGSTDELGVFEMSERGLQAVSNPSEIFLTESNYCSEVLAGLAVAAVMDGSRTFVVEIQALCSSSTLVARHVNGVPTSRADMIISVLMKQAGLKLQDNAIFINVVSGFKLTETAGDLAIAAAICSSFLEFPIANDIAFIGEIGLGGELRAVPRLDKRITGLSKLGYKKCVIPKAAEKSVKVLDLGALEIISCRNLKDVIHAVFV